MSLLCWYETREVVLTLLAWAAMRLQTASKISACVTMNREQKESVFHVLSSSGRGAPRGRLSFLPGLHQSGQKRLLEASSAEVPSCCWEPAKTLSATSVRSTAPARVRRLPSRNHHVEKTKKSRCEGGRVCRRSVLLSEFSMTKGACWQCERTTSVRRGGETSLPMRGASCSFSAST